MEFGFIGVGNMGGALATALCRQVGGENVLISRKNTALLPAQAETLGCHHGTVAQVAETCHFIFLGVKPQMLQGVFAEIAPILQTRTTPFVLVSMAAGVTIERLETMAGLSCPIIRLMPNTPVGIGQGMTLYCANQTVSQGDLTICLDALAQSGQLDPLPEHLFDIGTVVAGCSPAFVDLFVEALADGGVACGLPRAKAMEYAARALAGSANLILESGRHPGDLKDAVCSPGGSTIQGVRALEKGGFRSNVIEAVTAAYNKTQNL